MRDMIFLAIGMLLGGTVGALMLCMLQFGARSERIENEHESGDIRH